MKKVYWIIIGMVVFLAVSTYLDTIAFSRIMGFAGNESITFKIIYYTGRNLMEMGIFGLGVWAGILYMKWKGKK